MFSLWLLLAAWAAEPAPPPAEIDVRRCAASPEALPGGLVRLMEAAVEIRAGRASGTGFVISPDGFVVTAAHVVGGLREVEARVGGSEPVKATVLRSSAELDVALLYVGGADRSCMTQLPDDAPVGSDLWVIGAPRGDQAFSVMRGIVSATRTVRGVQLLQTDAAVNPGDSGGAMLDGTGRVRALVSWKVAGLAFEGISFGVPIGAALGALQVRLGDSSAADPLAIAAVPPPPAADDPAELARRERLRAMWAESERASRRTGIGLTTGGVVGVVAGGAMYLGTLGRYLGARDLPATDPKSIGLDEWRTMEAVNVTGIAVATVGATLTLVGGLTLKAHPASSVTVVPTIGGLQVVGVLP